LIRRSTMTRLPEVTDGQIGRVRERSTEPAAAASEVPPDGPQTPTRGEGF
jgi:hypothetical protein